MKTRPLARLENCASQLSTASTTKRQLVDRRIVHRAAKRKDSASSRRTPVRAACQWLSAFWPLARLWACSGRHLCFLQLQRRHGRRFHVHFQLHCQASRFGRSDAASALPPDCPVGCFFCALVIEVSDNNKKSRYFAFACPKPRIEGAGASLVRARFQGGNRGRIANDDARPSPLGYSGRS